MADGERTILSISCYESLKQTTHADQSTT